MNPAHDKARPPDGSRQPITRLAGHAAMSEDLQLPMCMLRELAQHCGHADILREQLTSE
jgi:Protein of unknown function (DUF664)